MRRFAMLLALAAASFPAQGQGTCEELGRHRGLGSLSTSTVAPGPAAASERLYLSYLYVNHTLDIVAVDPATGEHRVFPNPVPDEYGAHGMTAGPDGNVYIGTLPHAHLLKLDPKAGTLEDLGRPAPTEQYIWELTTGSDGNVYGVTYPEARLVRYDPVRKTSEDLGRMDPLEQYARWIAASDDGFLYIGIGTVKANIAAYEIATGRSRRILPEAYQTPALARVYRGEDGRVYGRVGAAHFRLGGWEATPIPASEAAPPRARNRLRDGRLVHVEHGKVRVADPRTRDAVEHPYSYAGNELALFRIGFASNGVLYGSSVLPIYLVRWDERTRTFPAIGALGGGEVYSFLAKDHYLLMAAYSAAAPLMQFDTRRPFSRGGGEANPRLLAADIVPGDWRPEAFIHGPDGKVYLGAVSSYGKLGGPLVEWDVDAGVVNRFDHVVDDQSVISLAAWKGLIVGGTTVRGGGGSRPTAKEAKLFLWDPAARRKLFETVPVPGASAINNLIVAASGMVYGMAGETLFVFDPARREVVERTQMPFRAAIYNAVAAGPDGRIWGLTREGVFVIHPETRQVTWAAKAPRPITGGFALRGNAVYFISGASVWRCPLPAAAGESP